MAAATFRRSYWRSTRRQTLKPADAGGKGAGVKRPDSPYCFWENFMGLLAGLPRS